MKSATGLKRWLLPVYILSAISWSHVGRAQPEKTKEVVPTSPLNVALSWQSPAKLHHVIAKEEGDLLIGPEGIQFRSRDGHVIKWPYLEVQTFALSAHNLAIETYENRQRHLPGVQRYRFDLRREISPDVAAMLAEEVQRPSQNAVPDTTSPGAVIPAHHRSITGGTNGDLRFRDGGIAYVTSVPGDGRSWRWADLQTLSRPDAYHLFVFGYRDSYTFDLKEPLPQSLFNRLTDALDAYDTAHSPERPNGPTENAHSRDKDLENE